MGFESAHAVDDLDSRPLEFARPDHVSRFVKPRFELDDNRDVFPKFCGPFEGSDNGTFPARAIEGLFDGQNVRVVGGFFDQADDWFEALVGMAQEDVLGSDVLEHRFGRIDLRGALGWPDGIPERGKSIDFDDAH